MKTIEMAREAGFDVHRQWNDDGTNRLERFAALIRADEREACAKVCEALFDMEDDSCSEAEQCAAAIRARGNK